ncbi:hypothetical protein KCP69_18535 [Salmonella enterica subsp. enterica]|nr:hypothetical protein KCP69_18535 [Salmonella enterica subsp. enterica]
MLDTFTSRTCAPFMENDSSLEDGDNNVIIREDAGATGYRTEIREACLFSRQNGLAAHAWKPCRFPATNGAAC